MASGSQEAQNNFSLIGKEAGFEDISASCGSGLPELCKNGSYDLVVMSLPLESEFGLETALRVSKLCPGGLLIISPSKIYEEVCAKGAKIPAPILPRSAPKAQVINIMRFLLSVRQSSIAANEETARLQGIVDEMKLVNRAKCVLIEYLRLSEQEAHYQLRKRAMDQRITLTEAALDILKIYEYQKPLGG
ncbi:MAG: ANTAR domain-containing protein [Oscillospiraceae bacterium]|nr:ANTAR domain-containing protein [Oscillospiraceae bacterium]